MEMKSEGSVTLLLPVQVPSHNLSTVHEPSGSEARHSAAGSTQSLLFRLSMAELRAIGKALREKCPRESHPDWICPTAKKTKQQPNTEI
jgi:hypothetical protein